MKQTLFLVESNRPLTRDVFELVLAGDTSEFSAPGQFAEISVPGLFLRRPISVCDWTASSMTLLVKVVGQGTAALGSMAPGESLDVLTGLGNGFECASRDGAVLVGGGIGIAPLYGLAKRLVAQGAAAPVAILGFRSAADVFYADEFAALGCDVRIATEDGSFGTKGFVTDAMAALPEPVYAYACGPMPMLRAVAARVADGEFSLEARMGCGFGACMGCTIETPSGPRRVCVDGPVFRLRDVPRL